MFSDPITGIESRSSHQSICAIFSVRFLVTYNLQYAIRFQRRTHTQTRTRTLYYTLNSCCLFFILTKLLDHCVHRNNSKVKNNYNKIKRKTNYNNVFCFYQMCHGLWSVIRSNVLRWRGKNSQTKRFTNIYCALENVF